VPSGGLLIDHSLIANCLVGCGIGKIPTGGFPISLASAEAVTKSKIFSGGEPLLLAPVKDDSATSPLASDKEFRASSAPFFPQSEPLDCHVSKIIADLLRRQTGFIVVVPAS